MEGKERKEVGEEGAAVERELVFDHNVSGPDSILAANLPPPTLSRAGAEKEGPAARYPTPIPAHVTLPPNP